MVTRRQIDELSNRIAKRFHPEKIVLFGSYASGKPTEDSDVDLLVVMPFSGRSVDQAVEMRMETRPAFPVDLIVRTPEAVSERLRLGDTFMSGILSAGRILYEASHA
jgi:predicted nucleotidyltransferase